MNKELNSYQKYRKWRVEREMHGQNEEKEMSNLKVFLLLLALDAVIFAIYFFFI